MISKLHVSKGDYCIVKGVNVFPYQDEDFWKIQNIQEIHYLCKDIETDKPCPIQIVNIKGESKWVSGLDLIKVSNPGVTF